MSEQYTRKFSLSRHLNIKDVEHITGKHRVTIWRWVKAGTFPEPQYINGQRTWTEGVVADWQSDLETFDEHHAE